MMVESPTFEIRKENTVKILTLNDIRNEMDTKELESWIKLTRVLTHHP